MSLKWVAIRILIPGALSSFHFTDCYRAGKIPERGQARQVMANSPITFSKNLGWLRGTRTGASGCPFFWRVITLCVWLLRWVDLSLYLELFTHLRLMRGGIDKRTTSNLHCESGILFDNTNNTSWTSTTRSDWRRLTSKIDWKHWYWLIGLFKVNAWYRYYHGWLKTLGLNWKI